jgi:hypothetical protein
MARKDVDATLDVRFGNAIQAAAVSANEKENRRVSGDLLAAFTGIEPGADQGGDAHAVLERLRPAPAQPWIDAFAELGVIPASFSASDRVK